MSRIKAAVWILVLVLLFSAIGHLTVRHITNQLCDQLTTVRNSASAHEFVTAQLQLTAAVSYYDKTQHILELFLKRETVASLGVNLYGVEAYLGEDNLPDLCTEIDKAIQQTKMLRHIFFSIF